MIKEIIVYEVDGVRFDDVNSAANYEDLCFDIERIMSRLKPRTKEIEDALDYGKQDPEEVRKCLAEFCNVCAKTIPLYKDWFIETGKGSRHLSRIGRVFPDYSNDYPCLWRTYYRFLCINMETGYEFQQAYYANNIEEAFKNIERRKKYLKENGTL